MAPTLPTLSLAQLQSQDPQTYPQIFSAISRAFGPQGPGILLINGLSDEFVSNRASLFSSARTLANLPPHQLSHLQSASHHFNGWSRARETFRGKVDACKGSFYANPMYDHPAGGTPHLVQKYPNYMAPNVWPAHPSCSQLEPSFKFIGRYVNQIALHLARHCDAYVARVLPPGVTCTSLHASLSTSNAAKGRLLNYYPPAAAPTSSTTDDDLTWCGYHNDHGTLTGLLSGQFYTTPDLNTLPTSPDPASGLYISRDHHPPEHVTIPADNVAFQLGESAQIATGGILRATPHAVVMPRQHTNVARVTLALFLQPNPWETLQMPPRMTHADKQDALRTNHRVPPLTERFVPGDTFGQFAQRTANAYMAK